MDKNQTMLLRDRKKKNLSKNNLQNQINKSKSYLKVLNITFKILKENLENKNLTMKVKVELKFTQIKIKINI